MKFTDGLFSPSSGTWPKDYPDIEPWENSSSTRLHEPRAAPEEHDVLVLPNLYEDIVSDLTAGLVGGLGVAPGANIGTDAAVFEATHGSAPKYTGQNQVNPTAMILSGRAHARAPRRARRRRAAQQAVASVIAEGERVTYDLKPTVTIRPRSGRRSTRTRSSARLRASLSTTARRRERQEEGRRSSGRATSERRAHSPSHGPTTPTSCSSTSSRTTRRARPST